jgi:hypothetical protein
MKIDIVRRLAAALAVSFVVGGAAHAQKAEECTWGTPGYRACVDRMLERRREADAKRPATAQNKGSSEFRTAPARRRPGTLTPAPSEVSRGIPMENTAPGRRAVERNQRQFDSTMQRLQQPPPQPIMPLNRDLNPIPGRVCPTWGC